MMRAPGDREGFALISALWATTALTTLALAIGLTQRSDRRAAQNQIDELRSTAAADAGIAHANALLRRLAPVARDGEPAHGLDPWSNLRAPDSAYALDDAWYTLELIDAGTRLNLNLATEEELGRLFIALRLNADDADRLAQRIADWRDPDDDHRARGAERDAYVAAGMPLPPANRGFMDVSELRRVLGIDEATYARLEPYLTIEGTRRIALHAAPPEVLLALPGMTPEAVIALLELRRDGRRVGHIAELGAFLPARARSEFQRHLPTLMGRLTLESTEIVAVVRGGVEGSAMRVTARALFVRSTGLVYMTEARVS